MKTVAELQTPVPIVDMAVVESNLLKMQAYCDSHGLRLRPHIKTHKSPELALRQLELGACGITCQKLGEAEVMADAGVRDILMSYPVLGVGKAERLAQLASRVKLTVQVESEAGLEALALAAKLSGQEIGALIDFDSGGNRTGVTTVEEALRLAKLMAHRDGVRFDGLMTYPLTAESQRFFLAAKETFDNAGIEISTFSGAATPVAWNCHEFAGLNEVRHGTYIYHDGSTVGDGAATLDDCAVHVVATVISRPTFGRAILDSGSKSLSSDRVPEATGQGFGLVREYPDAVIVRLYEEHAIVQVPEGMKGLEIGERVRVLPNHVCPVCNLHDEIVIVEGDQVQGVLQVKARGMTC